MNKLEILTRKASRLRGAWLIACLAGLLCQAASAGTYYVATNGSDAADGATWGTAFQTLNYAVSILSNDSTVYVSNGTYAITNVLDVPNKGLMHIQGVGGAENTIIDGQGTFQGIRGYRLILDGLTFSNCYYSNVASGGGGCLLLVNSIGNIIKNCVFVKCVATYTGGGLSIADQTGNAYDIPAIISNCTFIGNLAGEAGGGLDVQLSKSEVLDCRFIGNRANGGAAAWGGGGLWCGGNSRSNIIAGCVFSNNSTASRGGGVKAGTTAPGLIITNSTVVSNAAFLGGGIYAQNAFISGCTLVSNRANANGYGGGIYTVTTSCQVVNCRLIDNYAMRDGGGVFNNGLVAGCLLAGNTAANRGGGVCQTNALAAIRSSTIVSNAVVTNGGGVYLGGGSVENSIVYLNTAGISGSNWTYAAGSFTNTCTAPSVSAYGTGNIEDDPLFADALAGDYRLQSRSPCINAGLNQDWMAGAIDLDGNRRIRQVIVDMGAYEGLRDGTVFSVR